MRLHIQLLLLLLIVGSSAHADSFKVGVSAPLTGDLAEYGQAVRNGFLLSNSEHLNSHLQFIFEDNKYDAKEAVSTFRSLVTMKQVNLFFSWGETPLHAIAPLAQRAAVPTVAMSVDSSPAKGRNSIIIGVNAARQFVDTVANNMRARGFQKLCLIATEDPFLLALISAFKTTAFSVEQIQVAARVPPSERDFRALVTKLKSNSSCEALGVYLLSGQVGVFYRELTKQGVSLPTFGTDVFESRSEIQLGGSAMRGAVYPNIYVPSEFRELYQKSYSNDSQLGYAYNAYVIGSWFHSLFGDAHELSKSEVLLLLRTSPTTQPIERTLSDLSVTHLSFPLTLRRITDDGFEDSFNPTTTRAQMWR